jgi:hypothetical protein
VALAGDLGRRLMAMSPSSDDASGQPPGSPPRASAAITAGLVPVLAAGIGLFAGMLAIRSVSQWLALPRYVEFAAVIVVAAAAVYAQHYLKQRFGINA